MYKDMANDRLARESDFSRERGLTMLRAYRAITFIVSVTSVAIPIQTIK